MIFSSFSIGETGDQGARGEAGKAGEQGPGGIQGPKGPVGGQGPAGTILNTIQYFFLWIFMNCFTINLRLITNNNLPIYFRNITVIALWY